MFDNLRDLSDSPLYDDAQDDPFKEPDVVEAPAEAPVRNIRRRAGSFLGMTAQQRFLIAVMLMVTVCMLGTLAMFVLGKMSIL